ncbi:MAG: filamentous hemagglutinin N-terminal domain-containing protein [Nostoc sp. DedQUE04]|uniref:two-partner secretion domain-containing protein n=1 Tax=Nostoc sp. DedQUE04 TaxID=3075390 RepID=UPI002AD4F3B9|nr:filamentous hemagglutinin N-terminal domain-containing protein [Nostoc sp. DedQUE04]MDZ8135183.1 filamentous hemagglutinin N-terminal domain-containing protein [Nostoc sp. DedQUE04]
MPFAPSNTEANHVGIKNMLKNYPASIYWRSPINQTDFSKSCDKFTAVSNETQGLVCWHSKFVGLGSCLIIASVFIASLEERVFAQITPDTTLPTNSSVTTNGNIFNITGGTKAGSNLFHSFSEFSVPFGGTANFNININNTGDIQNIISRVTGGSVSNINGLIRVKTPANLFLINPNGIIFGSRARLDVKGSFVATTANAIAFGDRVIFSATNPTTSPLLTINPSAFLFNQIPTAPIQNNSTNLSVKNNLSLLLVGGDINMNGGSLKASGGRVELGGLAQEGIVGLNVNDNNLSLNFPPDRLRASLSLTKGAEVDVVSDGGGSITVNAQNIDISEGSSLRAGIKPLTTAANAKAGDITLSAKETVTVKDSSIYNAVFGLGDGGSLRVDTGKLIIQDGIVATATTSSGSAGDLVVNASDSIELTGSSSSNGAIDIFPINFFGYSPSFTVPIGLFSASIDTTPLLAPNLLSNVPLFFRNFLISSLPTASGNAGNMTIETGRLIVSNGAVVSAGSTTLGRAGNLFVNAKDSIELSGTSANDASQGLGLFTIGGRVPSGLRNETTGLGPGGDLTIDTERLIVRDGAWVTAGTAGEKPGGKLTVNASKLVEIKGIGRDNNVPSVLASGTQGSGKSGGMAITTKKLIVSDGGIISSGTSSLGKGGDLTINASESVELLGTSKQGVSADVLEQLIGISGGLVSNVVKDRPFPSGIITGTTGQGNAGNLVIKTGQLFIQDGAQASVSTTSVEKGNAGSLTVNATSIKLSGTSLEGSNLNDVVGRSLLTTATSKDSTGKGGDINLYTNSLEIIDGAALTASTSGQGDAGKITVNATDKVIISGSDFNYDDLVNNFSDRVENIGVSSGLFVSSTGLGTAGDIEINSPKIILDNQGKLNAESASGNGGNININSDLLLLRRNSQISTNAGTDKLSGNGGNIIINNLPNYRGFIVAVPNENSDITANAFEGSGGKVIINSAGIFGLQPRSRQELEQQLQTTDPNKLNPSQLLTSDITAISQSKPSLNGEINLNTPDTDPSRGLIQLPSNLVDASQQIAQGCTPRGRQTASRFIATGRGGLPLSPNEPLRGRAVITGWVDLPPQATQRVTDKLSTSVTKSTNQIVEAQGWIVDGKGDVILVAQYAQSSSIPSAMSCSR